MISPFDNNFYATINTFLLLRQLNANITIDLNQGNRFQNDL